MKVFIRAYTEYLNNEKSNKSVSENADTLAQKGEEVTTAARESITHTEQNPQKPVTGKIRHAVQLSLFPDFVAVEAYEPNKKNLNHG